jgi:hypothetical protein
MATYVILCNMIIEDEKVFDLEFFFCDVGTCVKQAFVSIGRGMVNNLPLLFISFHISFICDLKNYLYAKLFIICLIIWI